MKLLSYECRTEGTKMIELEGNTQVTTALIQQVCERGARLLAD
jgi:hypothetical protein